MFKSGQGASEHREWGSTSRCSPTNHIDREGALTPSERTIWNTIIKREQLFYICHRCRCSSRGLGTVVYCPACLEYLYRMKRTKP